jgi:predicted molibdopterin-dependent oxidoreductase YjgC
MVTRTETKTVTGKINGLDVTVPAGTTILEAARMAGIEVPNLCYQPLLRPGAPAAYAPSTSSASGAA